MERARIVCGKREDEERAILRGTFLLDRETPRNFYPPERIRDDRSRTRLRTRSRAFDDLREGWQEQQPPARMADPVPPHVVHYVLCAYSL